MQPSSPKTHAGVTLIELLFALAVIAILFGFATSGVSAMVNAARTSSGLANLVVALTSARTAAVNTGTDVVLCPSVDGDRCTSGDHWENGWIAFQALGPGSERDANEPIVLRQEALPAKVHLVSTKGRTRIRFQPSGGNGGSNATFTFCDGRGPRAAQAYAMSNRANLHAVTPEAANVTQACAGL